MGIEEILDRIAILKMNKWKEINSDTKNTSHKGAYILGYETALTEIANIIVESSKTYEVDNDNKEV